MPRVRTETVMVLGEQVKFVIDVSAAGVFSTKLHDGQYDVLRDLKPDGCSIEGYHKNRNARLTAQSLDTLLSGIGSWVRWSNEKTVTKELFICYRFDHHCAYVKDWDTGEIYENGTLAPSYGGNTNWYENGHHATAPTGAFSLGVGATCRVKLTSAAKDGSASVKWESPVYHSELLDAPAELLGRFAAIAVEPNGKGVEVVPYDPDLAQFLYEAMWACCVLADKMSSFFETPEATMLAAKQGAKLLAAPLSQ